MPESRMKYGIFKEEIKNRFLCIVNIDGLDELCYIPSSCRLANFIDMNNRKVMLIPVKSRNARTRYSVYAIQYRHSFVPIGLSNVNKIIQMNLHRRLFSFLGERKHALREKNIDDYKSDIYIEDTDTIVEIKSILSFVNVSFFPTVYSERANRQLRSIKELLLKEHKVCYILVSMYSGTRKIVINKEQTEYHSLFEECVELGMAVHGYSLYMNGEEPCVKKAVDCEY